MSPLLGWLFFGASVVFWEPSQPTGKLQTVWPPTSIPPILTLAPFQDRFLVAGGPAGLHLLEVTDGAIPRLVTTVTTDDDVVGLAIAESLVLVCKRNMGLDLFDWSRGDAPRRLGSCRLPGSASAVAVDPGRRLAWVAAEAGGVVAIDFEDPTRLGVLGTIIVPGKVVDLEVGRSTVWAATRNDGVYGIDSTDPVHPTIVGHWSPSEDSSDSVSSISVREPWALLAAGDEGVVILDLRDPRCPTLGARCSTPGLARAIELAGHLAWVADGDGGLIAIDVAKPQEPRILGGCPAGGWANALGLLGDDAFVALAGGGLEVVDLRNPVRPRRRWLTDGRISALALRDQTVWMAGGGSGLGSLDATRPLRPSAVGFDPVDLPVWSVAVRENLACLAARSGELWVYDVSDATQPTPIGRCQTRGSARGVALAESLALVADGRAGLTIVDLADPAHPTVRCNVRTEGEASNLAHSDGYVLLADGLAGLQVLYIRDDQPTRIGAVPSADFTWDVTWDGGRYAFAADGAAGLSVIDLADRGQPRRVATLGLGGLATDIVVRYGMAFVTRAFGGIDVVDVTHPLRPVLRSNQETTGSPGRLAVSSSMLFAAGGVSGLEVLPLVEVLPSCIVRVELRDGQLTLHWQGSEKGMRLESASKPDAVDWQEIPGSGNDSTWTLPTDQPAAFFRLVSH